MVNNIEVLRTNSENKDFIKLVEKLDAYLKITDEDEHEFYNQFNSIDVLKHIVVIYMDTLAVGCGAIKKIDITADMIKNKAAVEVKRMYVSKENRGTGIAQKIIQELENWAKELGYGKLVLETGRRQKEAVQFYHKCDYQVIDNYGQYKDMENSICFEKNL